MASEQTLREALEDFRDTVLNQRGQLEEGTTGALDNDQTNAVLTAFDEIVGAAPQPTEPVIDSYPLWSGIPPANSAVRGEK